MMITRGDGIKGGLAKGVRSRLSLGGSAVLMLVVVLRLCLRASLSRCIESDKKKKKEKKKQEKREKRDEERRWWICMHLMHWARRLCDWTCSYASLKRDTSEHYHQRYHYRT